VSLTLFFTSSLGPVVPWGLWQSEQAILPASSGWVELRWVWARSDLWQEKHTSGCVRLVSTGSDFTCTAWHDEQATSRLWCWLPSQWARLPDLWQPMQASPCAWALEAGKAPFLNTMSGAARPYSGITQHVLVAGAMAGLAGRRA